MDESSTSQNRRARRSNVLMTAALEVSGVSLEVKLRNLSAEGALVDGDRLPVEGSSVLFRKGDLSVAGQVVCTRGRQAGVAFAHDLDPVQLMRHVPAPRARVAPSFRRPGLGASALTREERKFGEQWLYGRPLDAPGD